MRSCIVDPLDVCVTTNQIYIYKQFKLWIAILRSIISSNSGWMVWWTVMTTFILCGLDSRLRKSMGKKVPYLCHSIELCSHVQTDLKDWSPEKESQDEKK